MNLGSVGGPGGDEQFAAPPPSGGRGDLYGFALGVIFALVVIAFLVYFLLLNPAPADTTPVASPGASAWLGSLRAAIG